MWWASRAGDGWLWGVCGLFVLLFGGSKKYHALAAASLAAISGVAVFMAVKRLTGRERPCKIEPHWADLIPPDRFSFPSGHAITAFAVSQTLGSFYPSWHWMLTLVALNIGASRVILGMHFLSDVLVGMILGLLIGHTAASMFL